MSVVTNKVQQHEGNDDGIDDGGGESDERPGLQDIPPETDPQFLVATQDFLFEGDAALFETEPELRMPLGEFGLELRFELGDLFREGRDLRGHRSSCFSRFDTY